MNSTATRTRSSATVAPEDLRVGDFIGVLQASCQVPTHFWFSELPQGATDESVRVTYMPTDGGVPLKVKAVSLPFVLVRTPGKRVETIDLRQCRIARLDRGYAKLAWKELRKQARADQCQK